MKKIYIFLLSYLLTIFQLSANNKSGHINGAETWSGSITLTGDIYVYQDDVLSIEPGTVIKSNGHYMIYVSQNGRIVAQGTAADSIWFTVADSTSYSLTSNSTAGAWEGFDYNSLSADADSSIFEYCSFKYTKGRYRNGGVFYVEGNNNFQYNKLRISHSNFKYNSTYYQRGGIVYLNYAGAKINDCNFEHAYSFYGGGMFYLNYSTATFENCEFTDGYSRDNGAIFYGYDATIDLTNCNLSASYSEDYGGAICTDNSTLNIKNTVFEDNYAEDYGGALRIDDTRLKIVNSSLINNSCRYYGGAIYMRSYSNVKIINTNVTGSSSDNNYNGEGLYISDRCDVEMYNSIVWGNDQNIYSETSENYLIFKDNIIEDGNTFSADVFENCLNADPLFTDAPGGDYSLQGTSPCINAAGNEIDYEKLPDYDLAGNDRVYQNVLDIGAYEYQSDVAVAATITGVASYENGDPIAGFEIYPGVTTDGSGNYSMSLGSNGIAYGDRAYLKAPANYAFYPTHLFFQKDTTINLTAYHGMVVDTVYAENSTIIWDADTVNIFSDVAVNNSLLNISAGTKVRFHKFNEIKVMGTGAIVAEGTETDTIEFFANNGHLFENDNNYNTDGSWNGFSFTQMDVLADSSIFEYCSFKYSKAINENGGLFYLRSQAGQEYSQLRISNSLISDNACSSYRQGGALYLYFSAATIENSVITNNYSKSQGGGIYVYYADIEISNTTVSNNTSASNNGGGIYLYKSNTIFTNVNIVDNFGSNGGGVYAEQYEPYFINCNISNNSASSLGEGISLYNTDAKLYNTIIYNDDDNINIQNGTPEFYSCNIKGGNTFGATVYEDCLEDDPDFTDADNGDYTVLSSSPCINAGTTNITGADLADTDMDGNPRIHQDFVDIGPYEYQFDVSPVFSGTALDRDSVPVQNFEIIPGVFTDANGDFEISTGQNDVALGDKVVFNNLTGKGFYPSFTRITNSKTDTIMAYDGIVVDTTYDEGAVIAWDADTIHVFKDVLLNSSKLDIRAGATVKFYDWYAIRLSGKSSITAKGTVTDSIAFIPADSSLYNISDNSLDGSWHGIRYTDMLENADSSVFEYCKFMYAKAHGSSETERAGGVMHIYDFDKIKIDHSVFIYNSTTAYNNYSYGAAMYMYYCDAQISNTLFKNNQTNSGYGYGGAIFNYASNVEFTNCQFIENSTQGYQGYGGAIYANNNSDTKLTNCLFQDNHTLGNSGYGGAIYFGNYCDFEIVKTQIINNQTSGSNAYGGALYVYYRCNFKIVNCEISNNQTNGSSAHGAGIYFNSIYDYDNTIVNTTITNNVANYNNTYGGGMYMQNSSIHLDNSILWGNTAFYTNQNQVYLSGYSPTFNNNNIEGGNTFGAGTYENNIDADPLFTDAASGDFSIQDGSPCINMGELDGFEALLPELDLADNPRIYESYVDMGAYENQNPSTATVTGTATYKDGSPVASFEILPGVFTDGSGNFSLTTGSNGLEVGKKAVFNNPSDHGFYPSYLMPRNGDHIDVTAWAGNVVDTTFNPGDVVNWNLDSVFVFNDILLDSVILNINEDTYVQFQGYYGIYVSGTGAIQAIGTEGNPITFMPADTTGYDFTSDAEDQFWKGFSFTDMSADADTSHFTYCNVHFAKKLYSESKGGAFYVNATEDNAFYGLDFSNCNITHNGTYSNSSYYNYGGAFYLYYAGANFDHCVIDTNIAYGYNCDGAGFYTAYASIKMSNCSVSYNRIDATHTSNYGGFYLYHTDLTADSTKIDDNFAKYYGAIRARNSEVKLTNSEITNNTSTYDYGGMYFQENSDLTMENSSLSYNKAGSGCDYGGLYIYGGNLTMVNTSIKGNQAQEYAGIRTYYTQSKFVDCEFVDNTSETNYAGLYTYNGNSNLYNCLFTGNTAGNNYGAFYNHDYNSYVYNSIFYNNSASYSPEIYDNRNLYMYNCIINQATSYYVNSYTSCINVDPLFNDALNGDYTLQSVSPAIDAGDTTNILDQLTEYDIIGNLRITKDNIDIGPYEYESVTAAFNSDILGGAAPVTVQFIDQSINNPTSWDWDFGDGNNSSDQSPTHTYTADGLYTVSLTATNANGSHTITKTDYISVANLEANFTADQTTGNPPFDVQFTDMSDGAPVWWLWDFGDGNYSYEQSPMHTFTNNGNYTVTLSVKSAQGDSTGITMTDYINVNSDFTLDDATVYTDQGYFYDDGGSAANYSNNLNKTMTFYPVTTGNVLKFDFEYFDVEADDDCAFDYLEVYDGTSTGADLIGTYCGNSTLTTVTATNSNGALTFRFISDGALTRPGWKAAITSFVPVVSGFTADITAGTSPLTVQFNDESDGDVLTYQWNFGDGNTSTEISPLHTYQYSGIYDVTLVVTGANNTDTLVRSDYIEVQKPASAPVSDFMADVMEGTAPLTVNFTDLSTYSPQSWAWDFNNDGFADATAANPTFTFTEPGTYSIKLTTSNETGSDIEFKPNYITVNYPLTPAFTQDESAGNAPLTVNFTDQSKGDPTSWSWDFGDGSALSTDQHPSHTYTSAGTYNVKLVVENAETIDSIIKNSAVMVTDEGVLPVAQFSANVTSGEAPLQVTFTNLSENSPNKFYWDFDNDGFIDANTQNPTTTYHEPGTYSVSLRVENANGEDTETKTAYIKVTQIPSAYFTVDKTSGDFPLTVTFTDKSDNSPTAWEWDFDNDGTTDATTQNATYTYTDAGTYSVKLMVSNSDGSDTFVQTDLITVTTPQYTVKFNDFDGSLIKQEIVAYGASATPPDDPDRTGYTFTGWNGTYTNVTDNEIVVATYTINTYKIVFVDWDETVLKTTTVNYNNDALPPANPERTGYTFTGWDDAYTNIAADDTIHAVYEINTYTVTFIDWDGSQINQQTVEYGSAATAPADPTRTGYTFSGWSKTFDIVITDLTVKAQYTINTYTVTFFDWDGTQLDQQTVNYGSDAVAPDSPEREGHIFTGWDVSFNNITADVNVTAVYTVLSYSVLFFDWDGTLLKQQTVDYGNSAIAPDDPERVGYTFTGWDTDFSSVTADLIIYPVYEENSYTVTFKVSFEGEPIENANVNFDGTNRATDSTGTAIFTEVYSGLYEYTVSYEDFYDQTGTVNVQTSNVIKQIEMEPIVVIGVQNNNATALSVYPNPANEIINIVTADSFDKLTLMNSKGETVFEKETVLGNGELEQIKVSDFEGGVYFMRFTNKDKTIVKAVIIK